MEKPAPKAISNASAGVDSKMSADGLGSVGVLLSSYHIGDMAGLLGLLLTWFTYRQAKAAKAAAQQAAATAIRRRDQLETAASLSELAGKLRSIRDIYRTDNWGSIEITKDHAVAIAVEIQAIELKNENLNKLMAEIEAVLREADPQIERVKDDSKRHKIQTSRSQRTNKLADQVDAFRLKEVKNG